MSLLPPNATPAEIAIAGLTSHVRDLPVPIRDLWNPATCPPAFLPWLAWSLSVDNWRSDWPEATKRAVIAASPRVHRLKGTVAALKTALTAVAGDLPVRLVEWFEAEGSGEPYTAFVEIDVSSAEAVDPLLTRDLVDAVEASKNARSHIGVRISAGIDAGLAVAGLIRRPLVTAVLAVAGEFRPNFQSPLASVALLRPPMVSVALAGTAL